MGRFEAATTTEAFRNVYGARPASFGEAAPWHRIDRAQRS
jgi:hypothetical protein